MRKLQWSLGLVLPFATFASANYLLAVVILVIAFSSSAYSQEEVIKFDVSLVTVSVAVKDHKGHALLGLKSEDFLVTDQDTPVSPEFFDSEGPASIVFVLDTSSSMQGRRWKSLLQGLKSFVKKARASNDYTIIAFNNHAYIVAESVSAAELGKCVTQLRPYGETAMYDGVMLGLDALKRVPKRNKALILISDGEDNSSRRKLAEVEKEVVARRATIYSVGLLLNEFCRLHINEACNGKETVKQLATVTGGLAFFPNAEDLSRVLTEISSEVNSQYSLSYYPPDKNAGWRKVEVSIAHAERPTLRYQQRYLIR